MSSMLTRTGINLERKGWFALAIVSYVSALATAPPNDHESRGEAHFHLGLWYFKHHLHHHARHHLEAAQRELQHTPQAKVLLGLTLTALSQVAQGLDHRQPNLTARDYGVEAYEMLTQTPLEDENPRQMLLALMQIGRTIYATAMPSDRVLLKQIHNRIDILEHRS